MQISMDKIQTMTVKGKPSQATKLALPLIITSACEYFALDCIWNVNYNMMLKLN
jgi:hypothetical protein